MLTLLGNPGPLCCSQITGSLTRSDGTFPTTNPAHTSHVNSPSQPAMGSRPFSLPQLWAPPTLDCLTLVPLLPPLAYGLPHLLMGSPFFTIFIYLFIVIIFIAFLPSHCGGSFPSQWSSSPSHCWAPPLLTVGSSPSHCLIGLLPPSAWGPFASHSSEGLLPIGSSPCYCGGCLPSWLLGSPPFLAGAPPLSLGIIPISFTQLWGFPTSLWGFHTSLWGFHTSLWGSSPFLHGASSRCGALPHLAHSTVGPTHICVGLFTIFPWVFISLWGSSPSRLLNCGASPHLSVGLFPLSL